MSKLHVILIFIALLTIGICRILFRINKLSRKLEFTENYLKKFQTFTMQLFKNNAFENGLYIWLTENVNKMQSLLGSNGILHNYKPPFANYVYSDYQVLVNTLSEIRRKTVHQDMIGICEDCFFRYIGQSKEILSSYTKQLRNPLLWLRESMNFIITLPLLLAYWFGLFSYSMFDRLSYSLFFRLLSFLITILYILGSIITIITGWDTFAMIAKKAIFSIK